MQSKPAQSPLIAGIDQSASAIGAPIAAADCQPHHDLPMDCNGSGSWRSALSPLLKLWSETLEMRKTAQGRQEPHSDRADISDRPEGENRLP